MKEEADKDIELQNRKSYQEAEFLMQQQQATKICSLCNRETPLYFYQQKDLASRLARKSQTKLYRMLLEDILAGSRGKYLMYVRVTGSYVRMCKCHKAPVHSYCATASVIRSRKIYCKKCNSHYNLWVRQESIYNNKLMGKLFQYILLALILITASGLCLVLDAYLKFRYFKEHPEQVKATKERLE